MANNGGPPPPPPPIIRPPGQFPMGQRPPQPPPGARPPSAGAHGQRPPQMQMHQGPMQLPPKIIQQSSRIRDITPQKLLTEADCLQKLTEYKAFSIRKVPALSPKEKPSWARAEVTEDIKKQVKKLGEKGKSIAEKRAALAQFQQGQVTALLDDLASKEFDRNFEWSLVQMDRIEKEVSSSRPGKKVFETAVMILYVKRAPLPGLNAVMLFQNIEKRRMESLRPPPPPEQQRPPPPPPHPEQRPPSAHGMRPGGEGPMFVTMEKGGHPKSPKSPRPRHRDRRYHDESDSGSSDSYDTASESGSEASSSLDTSISSRSDERHRRRRNSRTATRSHSRHRPKPKYLLDDRIVSPEPGRASEAYGVPHHPHNPHNPHHQQPPQRPYVPDVPRMVPAMDAVASAYQAGKEDAMAERFGERIQSPVSPQPVIIERIIERPPIERVIERPPIERIVESPRAVVSYSRLPERPRFAEPRYVEERYVDDRDIRSQEDEFLIRRREMEDEAFLRQERQRREAEEYIDRRPLERPEIIRPLDRPDIFNRRQSYSFRGDSSPSPTREYFDRRPSEPREYRRPEPPRRVFSQPTAHPFAQTLPRRYPPSTSSGGYTDGW
ncbi:uncharacterized protein PAC_06983 [Phialocephala subalpina]|uniref:Uncharacterized protein n=1 Tax=Phialocephala subalpina TaxID=576137 RepID=A0A1L7WWE6_9HELO|nr:uncharacterized protein PAC_06983 [Phialocephala subalpina]